MSQKKDSTNFDKILTRIGTTGRYQILVIILTGLGAIPVGAFNLANVFFAAIPDYWCTNRKNNTDVVNNTRYVDSNYNDSLVAIEHIAKRGEKCIYYPHGGNASADATTCTEWEFDTSVYYSTAATEWSLFCSSEWIASLSQTTYMIGFLFGAICFGALSDKFGRKTVYLLSQVLMILTGTSAAFMPNFWAFMAIRVVSGAASAGAFTAGFVIMMEIVGTDHRMKSGIFYQGWFALGYMLMAVAGYFLRDFRHIALFISVSPVLLLPAFWFLDESPRWLFAEGKVKRASAIIKRAARINNAEYPEDLILSESKQLTQTESSEYSTTASATVLDLLKTPNIRKKTLITCYLWFVTSLVYYGLSFGTRDLPGGPYFNLCLSGLMEFPSFILAVLLLDRVGRRWPMSLSLILGSICCLGMAAVPKSYGIVLMVLSMMGKFAISGSFAVIYVYSAELFPTIVRTVGIGSGSMCARVAAFVAPFIALLAQFWKPLPYFIFGVFTLVGGVLTFLLPETLHQCLPETIEDGEKFGKNSKGICHGLRLTKPKRKEDKNDVNINEESPEL